MTPLRRHPGSWPAGTAWSPIRGDVGPGVQYVAGNQAGLGVQCRRPHAGRCGDRLRASGTAHWWRGNSSSPRFRPRRTGLLPIRRPGRPDPLCGEGQVAPAATQLLLPGSARARTPDGPDGEPGRPCRVDGGGHRSRGVVPRAQSHQAVPAPVQRPPEGRQELPVAGGDRERRVAEAGGRPRSQADRGPLLRSLSERGRHPGHARPPVAVVSGADLLGHQVPPPSAAGEALPPVPHRAVFGPVCGVGGPRRVRPPGR